MQCTATSDFYEGSPAARTCTAKAITVDGRPGWCIRAEIHVDTDRTDAARATWSTWSSSTSAHPRRWPCSGARCRSATRAMIGQLDQVIGELRAG